MITATRHDNGFIGYEYKELTVKRSVESIYLDNYACFGWEMEGTSKPPQGSSYVSLKFKRDRKHPNKAELSRLQRQFEIHVSEIIFLERSKVLKAATIAYLVGLIGMVFMVGSVFAVTAENITLCIVLAIPAFAGWVAPYLLFRNFNSRKTAEVNPIIDKKYDELYQVCEKANGLLLN
jgi:hypothetical protein